MQFTVGIACKATEKLKGSLLTDYVRDLILTWNCNNMNRVAVATNWARKNSQSFLGFSKKLIVIMVVW